MQQKETNLRRDLHLLVAHALHYSGVASFCRSYRGRRLGRRDVCVLALHRVLPDDALAQMNSLPSIVLKEKTFVSILEYLQSHFQLISLVTFLDEMGSAKDRSKPWCLLTFDDGWKDNYTTAYPWLKKFGIPATIFLAVGWIGGEDSFWVESLLAAWKDEARRATMALNLARALECGNSPRVEDVIERLKHMPSQRRNDILKHLLPQKTRPTEEADQMLSWEEVGEMACQGMDFGCHTISHSLLTYETDSAVEHELVAGKHLLEERLGKKVRSFAYPNGDWDERVRERVKTAGYDCAFTTQRGWYVQGKDKYTIRRIMLHEGNVTGHDGEFSPAMLSFRLTGWH